MSTDRHDQLPKARTEKLIIKELPDETLVYDLVTDKAHCLNETAARVWRSCDGTRTASELCEAIKAESNQRVPIDVIWLALDQLEKFNLIEDSAWRPVGLQGMNRRDLIRRVGLATVALPLIVSISTSPAHAQASLFPPGQCCGNPSQCTSNDCTQTPTCVPPPPQAPSTKACA
jgi:hypothetical protein